MIKYKNEFNYNIRYFINIGKGKKHQSYICLLWAMPFLDNADWFVSYDLSKLLHVIQRQKYIFRY